MEFKLDKIDREIITELQKNASSSLSMYPLVLTFEGGIYKTTLYLQIYLQTQGGKFIICCGLEASLEESAF